MNTVVATAGLTKRYRDVVAVDQLTLNIKPGEIYAFIRMLLDMIKPNAGVVSFVGLNGARKTTTFGTNVHPGIASIWERVGYAVETPHAYPDLTVRENLEIARRLRRLNDIDAVPRVIKELKLEHYANRSAGTLSLGNTQRLALAKALIHHPDLLIVDEPTNGLDPAGIVEIRNLLRSLASMIIV